MKPERWKRLKELFNRAVELSGLERDAFVRDACAGDSELASELLELLKADDSAGSFLKRPASLADVAAVPDAVGPYRIEGVLGRGGMGVVYRAQHRDSGREVALKTVSIVHERLLGSIRREIAALAELDHPGVVAIVDTGVELGTPWYAMELVDGADLRSHCRGLDLVGTLRVVAALCDTLRYLHGEGVVHGDLKPGNVLVGADGHPVLVDFGLMTRFGGRVALGGYSLGPRAVGTAAYMAPEQAEGLPLDARADLFALGRLLRELVARFRDRSVALDELIDRLLAPEPRDRIGYADDVARALGVSTGTEAAHRSYLYRPSLAGRVEVAKVFQEHIDAALAGAGNIVYVTGESGIGKSRFVAEVGRHAQARGVSFLPGESTPERSSIPLAALSSPLQSIADRCRARGQRETERVFAEPAGVLSRYVPELVDLVDATVGDEGEAVEQARERIFAALTLVMNRAAAGTALLVAIDDLQWADDLTLGWLEYLQADRARAGSLLVVGMYRVEEASEALLRLSKGRRCPLDRLDGDGVAQMIGDMLAMRPAPRGLVDFLTGHAEGNPFFVAEYLRSSLDAGVLQRDGNGRWSVERAYESVQTPRPVQELVGLRLDGLSEPALALARAAAVLGRECSLEALAAVSTKGVSLASLLELRTRWVLGEGRAGGLRFAHDKIREAAYLLIEPGVRARLHERAARFFERSGTEESVIVARHWDRSGNPARARPHYLAGARSAKERFAQVEAEQMYRDYLRVSATPDAERVAARNELGAEVLSVLGRYRPARAQHLAARDEAREIGDRAQEAWSINRIASTELQLGNIAAAREAFSDSLRVFEEIGDVAMQGTAHMNLALIDRDGGRLDDARYRLEHRALPLHRASGNRHGEAKALVHLAFIAWRGGDFDRGIELCEQALELLRETEQRRWEGITTCVLAQLLVAKGELEVALDTFERALVIHVEVGDHSYRIESGYGRAGVLRRLGRVEEAAAMASEAEALCRSDGAERDLILALCEAGQVDLARGVSAAPRIAEIEALMAKLGFGKKGRHGLELAALERAQEAWSSGR